MIIMCSGGFDPLHVGHLRMFIHAERIGRVVVILNSDAWLIRKKGYVFMPFSERKEILEAVRYVSDVVSVDDADGTVCEALARYRPHYFANGGDRAIANAAEHEVCALNHIEELFGVGGGKAQSSSALMAAIPHQVHHHEFDIDPR